MAVYLEDWFVDALLDRLQERLQRVAEAEVMAHHTVPGDHIVRIPRVKSLPVSRIKVADVAVHHGDQL